MCRIFITSYSQNRRLRRINVISTDIWLACVYNYESAYSRLFIRKSGAIRASNRGHRARISPAAPSQYRTTTAARIRWYGRACANCTTYLLCNCWLQGWPRLGQPCYSILEAVIATTWTVFRVTNNLLIGLRQVFCKMNLKYYNL